jgi:hypothetical protein
MSELTKNEETGRASGGSFKELYKKRTRSSDITPEQFEALAISYFEWADTNQIKTCENAAFQGKVTQSLVTKPRVFTINGLVLFTGLSMATFSRFRKDPAYAHIMEWIDNVVFEQKYQLAANGVINASLIGKDLGIDKGAEINLNNSNVVNDGETIQDAIKSVLGEL